jgi:hypothetical protein
MSRVSSGLLLSTCLVMLIARAVLGDDTGFIAGTVKEVNGEPIAGASVQIIGTSLGYGTKLDGLFLIRGVSPGSYHLRISSVGLMLKDTANVVVRAGDTTRIEIVLEEGHIVGGLGEPFRMPYFVHFSYPLVGHPAYEYLSRGETMGDCRIQPHTWPILSTRRYSFYYDRFRPRSEDVRFGGEGQAACSLAVGTLKGGQSRWRIWREAVLGKSDAVKWLYQDGYHFAGMQLHTAGANGKSFAIAFQPVYGLEFIKTDDKRSEGRGWIRREDPLHDRLP